MNDIVGFMGAGQMATALAKGFVVSGQVNAEFIVAYDPAASAGEQWVGAVPGAALASSAVELVEQSGVIFLAVKPQHVAEVFRQIQHADTGNRLFVSIVAGVTLRQLTKGLGTERIVRVMPNTPCLVGAGAAGYSLASGVTPDDAQRVADLLGAVGLACELPESLLNAVTGLSGSGPAFVYQIIEALSDGGVLAGLPRDVATRFAAQTLLGAARMVLQTGEHPGVLKDRVASPGGTTIAGLHALEAGGLRAALIDAVLAATRRAEELGGSS